MPSNECRNLPSRGSGTPCESSYGRFCVIRANLVESQTDALKRMAPQFPVEICIRNFLGHPRARAMVVCFLPENSVESPVDAFKRIVAQFPVETRPRELLGHLVARARMLLGFLNRISWNRTPMPSNEPRHSFLPKHGIER